MDIDGWMDMKGAELELVSIYYVRQKEKKNEKKKKGMDVDVDVMAVITKYRQWDGWGTCSNASILYYSALLLKRSGME